MSKKIAHCIHHTHWDLIWYFTVQDAAVQFSYNMKEMIRGFKDGKIVNFFMDGQTAPIDEYLYMHPEDELYIEELVRSGKLIIGPFNSQLDCFISSGESVVNNLRLGIKTARKLGTISKIAYLPDSFGHSYDFPKIFNKFGIKDFVITRGVGDSYELGNEFYMESNDGSKLLVCTMLSGYGYGCYAFKEGILFEEEAKDYNKISVKSLIERLLKFSTVQNEFVFPLGFDQNPAILDIPKKIEFYNKKQDDIVFKLTTWEEFCNHVRAEGKNLQTHKSELFSTQYHRVHKSIFSARSDIKGLQDRCERILTYELQPLMSMLDSLGIEYDHGIIDKAWENLVKCQTHSSANLTDETNNYIERETKNVLNLATSAKIYLMKLVSISLEKDNSESYPLVVFNTLPEKRRIIGSFKILTKTPNFKILDENGDNISFTVVKSIKKNCGVLRKDAELIDYSKFYYETDIVFKTCEFNGISYKTFSVIEVDEASFNLFTQYDRFIENNRYKIYQNQDGIVIHDKKLDLKIEKAIYIEESGDEGDSFDYSYPDHDLILHDYMDNSDVDYRISKEISIMKIKGKMLIPSDLSKRKTKICDDEMLYSIQISLKKDSDVIEISGEVDNKSEQHRVRIVFRGTSKNEYSYAGTQYGYIKRKTNPEELKIWREEKWFEEPSPTFPLLNHVSMVNEDYTVSVFTRSSKEYEFIGNNFSDISITLFRSYGALGYPDLNRRPGRPSGLDYMVFSTPECQMKKKNKFELALYFNKKYDANKITNAYVEYACEDSYYQKQDFDKSINPISYFPTNPLSKPLPRSYEFMEVKDLDGSFGTIVKSDLSESYILRLYNNKNHPSSGGELIGYNNGKEAYITDMIDELEIVDVSNKLPEMNGGELRIIKIKK
ncbi:glycoside hydrolase family 38 N-terminal domain-containing protein [Paratissierella segnis]|uniref:PTS fructose transporter subunit IIA n=1 Tax=Paratissierella segnis TaxID=2763679 RepID=A0A926EVM6_9FIRM|nr:glycoside hydrolase family 38 C-terminal domain-containing protein [Paratissierella segnis]MBC8587299.1 PTS fructose transporter subunit IIA [Paratissierella segnis]